ncbi:MAG: DUF29 domain-containing protein [Microcystaceae cyanobacterium]
MANNLYETDYEQWLENQTIALKKRQPDLLDWDNLLELLEMGNPKDTVESNLVILIAHLLKLYVQSDAPDWMTLSWYRSIDEHRNRILYQIRLNGHKIRKRNDEDTQDAQTNHNCSSPKFRGTI